MKIIKLIPCKNYVLRVFVDNGNIYDFDVLKEIKRIPSYTPLLNVEFFKTAKIDLDRIYWGDIYGSIDFHIDQVISLGKYINPKSAGLII